MVGSEVKGATRWVSIAGFTLQPSELAKPLFAIVSAWLLTLWREGQDFPGWAYATVLLGIIVDHSGGTARYWHDFDDASDLGLSDVSGWHADVICNRRRACRPSAVLPWLICICRMSPCGLINFLKADHGKLNAPWRVLPQVGILVLARVMGG